MDDPKELISPEYIPHALAVGALCNAWSELETGARMLLLKASGMPASKLTFGIVHCFDFRDCLEAIKLAIIEAKWPKHVTDEALGCLNYVNSILRVRRNRFIHDTWVYDEQVGAMARFNNTPKTFKPQAFQLDWHPRTITEETAEDIWDTTREVEAHTGQLALMQPLFSGSEGAGEALLLARPQRQFLRPLSEKPDPPEPETEELPPQPQS